MDAATIVERPAAGPETANCEPLINDTTNPPMIPDNSPAYNGAPDAKAIPKHSGRATRNTESPAGKSYFNQMIR